MRPRHIIIILSSIAIVGVGVFIKNLLAVPKEKPPREQQTKTTTVFTQKVANQDIPLSVSATGTVEAIDRLELYSEVQGVMLSDGGKFKAGNTFRSGESLLRMRSTDVNAQVVAQRSGFQRLVTTIIPDLKIDFPQEAEAWVQYLKKLDPEKAVPNLPDVGNDKLKLFLTGRNVYTEFYSVKNAQINLSKYRISAPFSGMLTEANADPGTVVRPGMMLGVFVKPNDYEVRVSVNAITAAKLSKGQEVELLSSALDTPIKGKISRINTAINPQTQMGEFFVAVKNELLKDGMFVEVEAGAQTVSEAVELPRSVLRDDQQIFVVRNGKLALQSVELVHTKSQTVVLKGLPEGSEALTKVPPGAYEGMEVVIYQEKAQS